MQKMQVHQFFEHGVRNEIDEDARYSEMPNFGEILEPHEIKAVTNFVVSLSGGDVLNPELV